MLQESEIRDGLTRDELFARGEGITFDDIIILPPFSEIEAKEVRLTTPLSRSIELQLPLLSAPMDSVTEWKTAIRMALHGALGCIHFNLSPEEAARQVRRVKRFCVGFIYEPICRRPEDPISEVERVKAEQGFSTLLITEDGTPQTKLLGMAMKGNVALHEEDETTLGQIMIPLTELCTRPARTVPDLRTARSILRQEKSASKLPLLNDDGSIFALVTRDDVGTNRQYPKALLDDNAQLRVGAAVSTRSEDFIRVEALLDAGIDVLVIDAAQGGTRFAEGLIKLIRRASPQVVIVAGNVVTTRQAAPLIAAGADALRVGMGSGSICTTQEVLGLGSSQLSAVYNVSRLASDHGVAVISDGGIGTTADIVKALVCGAQAVMVGRYIAGCDETPAEDRFEEDGRRFKKYRGMGSLGALQRGGALRYNDVADRDLAVIQGVELEVPYQGSLDSRLTHPAAYVAKSLE